MKILIVGGGIAGLSTALSLHAAGFTPTAYEAAAKAAPLGVGINVLPHAMPYGHGLADIETDDTGATAHFLDRATGAPRGSVRADLIIGAEGIHSAVPRKFYPREVARSEFLPPFAGWRWPGVDVPAMVDQ